MNNDILVSPNLSHWPLLLLPIVQKSFSRFQFYLTWSNYQCNKYVLVCNFVYVTLWTFVAKDIYGYRDMLNHNNIIWNIILWGLCDFSYGCVLMTWVIALVNKSNLLKFEQWGFVWEAGMCKSKYLSSFSILDSNSKFKPMHFCFYVLILNSFQVVCCVGLVLCFFQSLWNLLLCWLWKTSNLGASWLF